jgi:hypothetical protein
MASEHNLMTALAAVLEAVTAAGREREKGAGVERLERAVADLVAEVQAVDQVEAFTQTLRQIQTFSDPHVVHRGRTAVERLQVIHELVERALFTEAEADLPPASSPPTLKVFSNAPPEDPVDG